MTNIKMVFVGDGMQKTDLLCRAQRESLSNCIFVDPMPKAELAALLQSADIGLMILANVEAFYYGTSPNKFFDYIATGMPVLCNYPGWVSELLQEWEAGIAVLPDDSNGFADAILNLAAEPEQLEVMARQARKLAETEFDRDKLAKKFVHVLESVVGNEKDV